MFLLKCYLQKLIECGSSVGITVVYKCFISAFSIYSLVFSSWASCSIVLDNCTNDSVVLKWNSSAEELIGYDIFDQNSSYFILEGESEDSYQRSVNMARATSPYTINNLTPGITYYFKLDYIIQGFLKEYSKAFTTKPNEPDNVICTLDKNEVFIEWNQPLNHTFYDSFGIAVQAQNLNGSSKYIDFREWHLDSPFIASYDMTKYKSCKISINTSSNGKKSEVVEVMCYKPPSTPTDVNYQTFNSFSFEIKWKPPKNDIELKGYKVSIANLEERHVTKQGPLSVKFSNGIKPGKTYSVKVYALTENHSSHSKSLNVTTPPLPVFGESVIPGRISDLNISWKIQNESYQDAIRVVYMTTGQKEIIIAEGNQTFAHLTRLIPASNYMIQVIAQSNGIASAPVTIYQTTLPITPIFETFNQTSNESLNVSWTFSGQISEINHFKIKHTRLDNNQTKETIVLDSCWTELNGLFPGAQYLFVIKAIKFELASEPDTFTFTIEPLPPTNVNIVNHTYSSVMLTWDNPENSLYEYFIVKIRYLGLKEWEDSKPIKTNWTKVDNLYSPEYYVFRLVSFSNGKQSTKFSNFTEVRLITKDTVKEIHYFNLTDNHRKVLWNGHNPVDQDQNMIILIGFLLGFCIVVAGLIFLIKFEKISKLICKLFKKEVRSSEKEEEDILLSKIDKNIIIDPKDLDIQQEIGTGQFGKVFLGNLLSRDGRVETRVAIKQSKIQHDEKDLDKFVEEAIIMKNFNHVNVLKLIGVCTECDGTPSVVLPFMERGDLLSYLRDPTNEPTIEQLLNFAIDVAKGMDYLSERQFVHRDLAARNCMLDTDLIVKVADFGMTRNIREKSYYKSEDIDQRVPLRWMPLESIFKHKYDTKSDVWSYGVLMWEILTRGEVPYYGLGNLQVIEYIRRGQRLERPQFCPEKVYLIMNSCWAVDPGDRPNFAQLSQNLNEFIETSKLINTFNANHYINMEV